MERTLDESVTKARAEVRSALYDLENILDQAQESHNLFLGQAITLKRTLKSARSAILDASDQCPQLSE
ncbi:MAG: hypothetical protein FWD99_08760 [Oscillospiraceae bacterium]|nr:hypothetical protein [Oscillospiraceae bacterium]